MGSLEGGLGFRVQGCLDVTAIMEHSRTRVFKIGSLIVGVPRILIMAFGGVLGVPTFGNLSYFPRSLAG